MISISTFNKEARTYNGVKTVYLQQVVLGKLDSACKSMKTHPHTIHKNKLNALKTLRHDTIKLLEENTGKSYQCFPRSVSQGNRNESNNKQMGPNQIYTLSRSKETINKTKRQHTEWEKIPANDVTNNGLISKTYKQLIQLTRTKNKHYQKMGRRHFMKGWSPLLIITEMHIKITTRYHFLSARMVIIKKSTNNKCWRGCGEKGTLLHHRWECVGKLMQPLWKTV